MYKRQARCGVIAEGQEYFQEVIEVPSKMPDDIIFEALLSLPSAAYKLKTGKEFNYAPQQKIETHDFQ